MTWLYKSIYQCRLCKSPKLSNLIDFGNVNLYTANTGVIAGKGDPELHTNLPLTFKICANCTNMQLGEVVNPKILYKNFQYETKVSLGLNEHFKELAEKILTNLKINKSDRILDVGSNDGSFLKNFKGIANILGIEPGKKVAIKANKSGIPTISNYFSANLASALLKDGKKFKLIFCANTIANIDDLDEIFESFKKILSKNGYIIIETQNGQSVIQKFLIDTIYHEHLNYFTLTSLKKFLALKKLRIDGIALHEQKGGSMQLWITHASNSKKVCLKEDGSRSQLFLDSNLRDIDLIKRHLDRLMGIQINRIKNLRGKLVCYGASVGANTLLNLFFRHKKIQCILDDNPTIDHLPLSGDLVPVVSPEKYKLNSDVRIVVLAYRYFDEIIKRNPRLPKNRFYKIIDPS